MSTGDDLAARLRAADPAARLEPLGPGRVPRLLESAMTTTSTPARSRRKPLLALAGAGLAAAAIVAFTWSPATAPTRLTAGDDALASCLPVTAADLARAPLAFQATVETIEGGVVTLKVTHTYAGKPAEEVEIRQNTTTDVALTGANVYRPGDRYLIAAADSTVWTCGFSGPAGKDLQAVYDQAFGR